jgi:hypothetical protein
VKREADPNIVYETLVLTSQKTTSCLLIKLIFCLGGNVELLVVE